MDLVSMKQVMKIPRLWAAGAQVRYWNRAGTWGACVGLAALILALAGCGENETGEARGIAGLGSDKGDVSAGAELFLHLCIDCHGSAGETPPRRGARPLRDGSAEKGIETLKWFQRPTGDTPWWAEYKVGLSDRQISDILAYLALLRSRHGDSAPGTASVRD